MTKADIIAALGSKFAAVGTPVQQGETVAGVTTYFVRAFDTNGVAAVWQNVIFYVKGEGTAGEEAYWSQREPKPPAPPPSFESRLTAKIADAIGASQIVAGFVDSVGQRNERAIVSIVREQAGVYTRSERVAWLTKDQNGNDVLNHAPLA